MFEYFKNRPHKGVPWSLPGLADGIAMMARALERMEVVGGHVEHDAHGVPRIFFDAAGAAQTPRRRTFDLSVEDGVAKCVRCWYLRGPVWVRREEEPTLELPTGGVEFVLSAKINTLTGEVALDAGYDSVVPDTSEFVRVPLYLFARASESAGWRVSVDLRPGMVTLYV